jgi:retron-type reverse transcriptase
VLLAILARDIKDGRMLNLIRRSLDAGVLEDWTYQHTYSGTPQGGVLSPLLSNIYLHELDTFIEDTLIPHYTRGQKRKKNRDYGRLEREMNRAKARNDRQAVKRLQQERRACPSQDTHDPNYRRLSYVRYADDVRHLTHHEILLAEKGGSEEKRPSGHLTYLESKGEGERSM